MPTISAIVKNRVHRSFRVAQVEGMFGETIRNEAKRFPKCDLPDVDADWRIGLVVGPSGSGKTTIARAAFGDAVYVPGDWPTDRAIVDGFGERPIKQIVRTLTAVGLGSPPSWLRPYDMLSTGERFRCDLARAIMECGVRNVEFGRVGGDERPPCVVFDEFTSVVDRRLACLSSAALARLVRRSDPPIKFVAVTCHDDVARWLEPDWMLDMGVSSGDSSGRLSRRRLWRPRIELEIYHTGREAWPAFAPHHYLSGGLHRSARCYVGTVGLWDRRTVGLTTNSPGHTVPRSHTPTVLPIAFAATLPLVGRKAHRRYHRLVVLPDYQGIGIGGRFLDAVAGFHREEGQRINIATSHPAIVAHCRASPCWRTVYVSRTGRKPRVIAGCVHDHSFGRAVVSFEFEGEPSLPATERGPRTCRSPAPTAQ